IVLIARVPPQGVTEVIGRVRRHRPQATGLVRDAASAPLTGHLPLVHGTPDAPVAAELLSECIEGHLIGSGRHVRPRPVLLFFFKLPKSHVPATRGGGRQHATESRRESPGTAHPSLRRTHEGSRT